MKRVLSWVALYFGSALVTLIGVLVLRFTFGLLGAIESYSKIIYFVAWIFFGCEILGLILIPLFMGLPLLIGAVESICKSKHGTRYIVMGLFAIVSAIFNLLVNGFVFNYDTLPYWYQLVFYIAMLATFRKMLEE